MTLARVAPGIDVLAVLVFVALGRDTHDEGVTISSTLRTAAPFLIAVGFGWVTVRAWRTPLAPRTGALIAGTTVVVGLALRRLVFSDGTALTFVFVTALFLGGAMIGWRVVARDRRS